MLCYMFYLIHPTRSPEDNPRDTRHTLVFAHNGVGRGTPLSNSPRHPLAPHIRFVQDVNRMTPYPPLCSETFIAYSNWPATPPTSMLLRPAQKLTSWVGHHHHAANRRSSSSRAAARTPPRPASKLVVPDQMPQPLRLSEATIRCGSHHHQIYNGASTRCCICSSEL